ncbi:uncharacterized protein APUU_81000A [Aspergillus puulaauensis]|uniref:DUF1254 domain-containing protein n=1 Tax=Aspergillus puulaauensis TaxID=1220207 RepID=A0A7R7XZP8_9EURO|nr:uncharacterized protein APUU_81000A [Aspergillus puulaauensis]BCS30697.1 hypothetical protein APUU_81000A [Aspergillus puulaauensis]
MKLSILKYSVWLARLVPSTYSTTLGQAGPSVDEATEFSLIYGYPLLAYAQFALPLLSGKYGTNTLDHGRGLATAAFQSVVRPNVDTLYSMAVLDLSAKDLVIEIPPMGDRYWVFPFYDLYGNNYANIGSVSNNSPGKYRISYANDIGQEPGIQLCEEKAQRCRNQDRDCNGLRGYINSPTPYGALVGRFLVKNNDSDLQSIHSLQNQTSLYSVLADRKHPTPELAAALVNESLSSDVPTRIMQMAARFTPFNPSRNISDQPRVECMLRKAGIHDGRFTPTGINLTAIAERSQQDVLRHASSPPMVVDLKNNWYGISPPAQGDYGTDYKERYYIAYYGYLALVSSQAVYPTYRDPTNEGSATLFLASKEAYTITFSSKPPLAQDGFWSITAYDAEQYLIPNPLNRYALGDRSDLTSQCSTGPENASFQILVQPADAEPPQNWTSK